jgi:SNF2 family DNA or RNA helicase
MAATIELHQDGGSAVIRAKGWLGDRFGVFRSAIEGATYRPSDRSNVAALDKVPAILRRLREAEFVVAVDDELKASLEKFTAQQWVDLQGAKERIEVFDAELQKTGRHMFGYQKYGSQWLAIRHGALLADEQGTGKTLQAIAAIPAKSPIVVVAPAVAKGVWQREVAKWRPHLCVRVLSGRGSFAWPEPGEMVVVNYDILPEIHTDTCKKKKHKLPDGEECKGCAPFLDECPENLTIIADEAHALKNGKAARTQKFRALGRTARAKSGRTWLLTGTPLMNRPQELWSVYQAGGIAQEAFGTWKGFMNLFQGRPAQFGGYTWGSPQPEVVERMQRVCLRRRREEVMPELPRKRWESLSVEVDKKTLRTCDEVLKRYGGIEKLVKLIESDGLGFEEMSAVRAALAASKIPAMLSLVENFEEQEEPVVVFSAYRAPVDTLATRSGWAVITGDTPPDERSRIEDAFQAGRLKGVASTIKAGGVAITLTRAAHALFVDLEWTPALNAQAEDRICRIGQTRGCVITTLTAEHPLDERIVELLTQKSQLIDASVDAAREMQMLTDVQVQGVDFEALIRAAEEEVRLADESLARKAKKGEPEKPKRRPPTSEQELWAMNALETLAGLSPDGAQQKNDVGFNRLDASFGMKLASELGVGLTDKQWKVAIEMCRKYHRQVGRCP